MGSLLLRNRLSDCDGLVRILIGILLGNKLRLLVDRILLLIELRRCHVGVHARGLHLLLGHRHVVLRLCSERRPLVNEVLLLCAGQGVLGCQVHHQDLLPALHADAADTEAHADEGAEDDQEDDPASEVDSGFRGLGVVSVRVVRVVRVRVVRVVRVVVVRVIVGVVIVGRAIAKRVVGVAI